MLNVAADLPLILWTLWMFVVGAAVGSMLNVCIARLPFEKSILWPLGSRCGNCLQPIRWYDNIPLLSYWLLRGRCRTCGARFSARYFVIELFTASLFAGIFYLEVIRNVQGMDFIRRNQWHIRNGLIPWQLWVYLLHRFTLIAFLIVAAACDWQSREIPLSITVTGTLIGLFFSAFVPWPWPEDLALVPVGGPPWWLLGGPAKLPVGAQLWPFWGPAPDWLPFGSETNGLATSLIGLLTGTWLLRSVRYLATRGLGKEALGLGDADLMMMVGAFLGWQAVVIAFFTSALVTLVLALVQLFIFHDDSLPFGPGLAIGTVLAIIGWNSLGPAFQPILFNGELLALGVACGAFFLFALCWMMGLRHRGKA